MDKQIQEFGGYKDYDEHEVNVIDSVLTYLWNKRPFKECSSKIEVWQEAIRMYGGTKEFALLDAMNNYSGG